jgi:hypothetical protein
LKLQGSGYQWDTVSRLISVQFTLMRDRMNGVGCFLGCK